MLTVNTGILTTAIHHKLKGLRLKDFYTKQIQKNIRNKSTYCFNFSLSFINFEFLKRVLRFMEEATVNGQKAANKS